MSEGPIVCNSGPLIALASVEQLGVLEKLYRRVLVPEIVVHEVLGAGAGRIGAKELAAAHGSRGLRLRHLLSLC